MRAHGLSQRALLSQLSKRPIEGNHESFGLSRAGGMALTIWSAGTRRVRVPMLPFSKAPLGPRATSTVCSM